MDLSSFNLWTFNSNQKVLPSTRPCKSGIPGAAHDSMRVHKTRCLVASRSWYHRRLSGLLGMSSHYLTLGTPAVPVMDVLAGVVHTRLKPLLGDNHRKKELSNHTPPPR